MKGSKALGLGFGGALALLALLQLVPYGRAHTNPPAGAKVAWDSPRTEELARRACFDCHSNETRWPWYSNIAPLSWRIQNHVTEGREKLNFSDFRPGNKDVAEAAGEAAETVQKGEMPVSDYLLAHTEARLTPAEKGALMEGLRSTFAAFGEDGGAAGGVEVRKAGSAAGVASASAGRDESGEREQQAEGAVKSEAAERAGRGEAAERAGRGEAAERER